MQMPQTTGESSPGNLPAAGGQWGCSGALRAVLGMNRGRPWQAADKVAAEPLPGTAADRGFTPHCAGCKAAAGCRATCRQAGSRRTACGRCRTHHRLAEAVENRARDGACSGCVMETEGQCAGGEAHAWSPNRAGAAAAQRPIAPAFHVQLATACHFLIFTSNVMLLGSQTSVQAGGA